MSAKFRFVLILMLAVFVLQSVSVGQTLPPAIRWIPQDAVISLELAQPKALLDLLAGEKASAFVEALPAYQELASTPQFQEILTLLGYMETELGTDWRTALTKLTGGGITLAICPEETVVLIIDAEDEQLLERFGEMLLGMARSDAEQKGQPGRVASTQYRDVTAWTFDGKEAHAIIGKRLVMANRPEGLKAVLELRAETWGDNLASKKSYRAAKRHLSRGGGNAVATVFADLELLMQIPDIAGLLKQQGENPLAALAFAGIVEGLRDSNWLALGLAIEDETLICRASVDCETVARTSPAAFALPAEPGEGALPNLDVPRRIAAVTLYRDLHQF